MIRILLVAARVSTVATFVPSTRTSTLAVTSSRSRSQLRRRRPMAAKNVSSRCGGVWRVTREKGTAMAVTAFRDFPLGDRDASWDGAAAEKRVRKWADAEDGPNEKYRDAH